jgi:quercetin dioxygenase-like cupin family protein
MPRVGRVLTLASGDTMELIETAAMTDGTHVRTRLVFKAGGLKVEPHLHVHQDESYEVLSGRLAYTLAGQPHVADAGTTVTLPRGIAHQHYSAGPEDTVVIQTMRPALDFDYLIENIFGLGAEGRGAAGLDNTVQGLVWIRHMRSTLLVERVPRWLQYGLAWIVAPPARLFGYRPVHRRFSDEDW